MGQQITKFLDLFDPEKILEKLREGCPLSDEDLEDLRMNSKLPILTILKLYRRFQEYIEVLHPDNFNVLEIPENKFKHIPALHFNPLRRRVIMCCRKKKEEKKPIVFSDFVNMMSILNPDGKIDVKLKFAFRLYDFDEDGKIGFEDLKKYLNAVTLFDTAAAATNGDKGGGKDKEKVETNGKSAKNGRKGEKKEDDIYNISPEEVIDRIARKTMTECGGAEAESDPTVAFIKLEDFAKTLMHSDFAGKYALHLNLGHSSKVLFTKILEDLKQTKDTIDDSDDEEEPKPEEKKSSIKLPNSAVAESTNLAAQKKPEERRVEIKVEEEEKDEYPYDDDQYSDELSDYTDEEDPYEDYMNQLGPNEQRGGNR